MAGNCSTHGAREQANYITAGERHLGVEKKGSHRLPKWVTGLFLSGVLWAWHILHYLRMIYDHSLEMPPKCPRSLMGVCVPPQLTVDTWNLPFLFSFISRAKKWCLHKPHCLLAMTRAAWLEHWCRDGISCQQMYTAHTCTACSLSSGCAHSPGSQVFSPGSHCSCFLKTSLFFSFPFLSFWGRLGQSKPAECRVNPFLPCQHFLLSLRIPGILLVTPPFRQIFKSKLCSLARACLHA